MCRSLDFKNFKSCTNAYRGRIEYSKFQSKKEKNRQRDEYQSKTEHIHLHLRIVKFEKYSEDEEGRLLVTAAAVQRYLNQYQKTSMFKKVYELRKMKYTLSSMELSDGKDLPQLKNKKKKKLKVTRANMLQLWEEHKPDLKL